MRFPHAGTSWTIYRLPWAGVLIVAACAGCGTADPAGERPSAVTAEPALAAGEGRGFLSRTYVDEAGHEHRYVVFVPYETRPGEKRPVVMFLNGVGENGTDGVRQISNNFGFEVWEMQDFFPFLVVCPQCSEGGSWSPDSADSRWALRILDRVIDEYDADRDRVYLTGVSSGGAGVWQIGSQFPERFAALVPFCGSGGDPRRLGDARMPVWAFCNERDDPGLLNSLQQNHAAMLRQGASPLLTVFDAAGHDCWTAGYRMAAMYRWLLQQSRSRMAREGGYTLLLPDELLKSWRAARSGTWRAAEPDVLVGLGDTAEGWLVSDTATGELHGELWLPADSVREVALFGDESSAEPEFRLSLMLPALGSGGVLRVADATWLCELDLAAQQWLRANAWNDVRIHWLHGRLTVLLNGWPAIDVALNAADASADSCRLAFLAPADGTEVRWRRVRIRARTEPALANAEVRP